MLPVDVQSSLVNSGSYRGVVGLVIANGLSFEKRDVAITLVCIVAFYVLSLNCVC